MNKLIDFFREKISPWLTRILWMLPILLFFGITSGIMPTYGPNTSIFQRIVPFAFTAGTTLWAWHVSKTHYPKVKEKMTKPIMLLFVPLAFIYGFLIETSFNFERFIQERADNAMWEHMNFHLLNDFWVIILMFFIAWLFFREIQTRKWTLLFSFILPLSLYPFFISNAGKDTTSEMIFFGLLWIWLFHVVWFLTSLLVRPKP